MLVIFINHECSTHFYQIESLEPTQNTAMNHEFLLILIKLIHGICPTLIFGSIKLLIAKNKKKQPTKSNKKRVEEHAALPTIFAQFRPNIDEFVASFRGALLKTSWITKRTNQLQEIITKKDQNWIRNRNCLQNLAQK